MMVSLEERLELCFGRAFGIVEKLKLEDQG